MYSQMSTVKMRPNRSNNTYGSHLATYQGQPIRKSICQQGRKDKLSQRVLTETSQKCHSIGTEMKKIIRQFRMPFKSTSPQLKHKNQTNLTNHTKLAFSTTAQPKKKVNAVNARPVLTKNNTEIGPIIKKKKPLGEKEKIEKKIINVMKEIKEEKREEKKEDKRNKPSACKKLIECRSMDKLGEKTTVDKHGKNKGNQKKPSATFDCTPKNLSQADIQYLNLIGQGTFGKVYRAKLSKTGQTVAVKKVFQDPKYKNRQIQIVSMLQGEYTMRVLGTFTTTQQNSQYLNIVMDYYDSDLFALIRSDKKKMNEKDMRVLIYQIFRGMLYIHSLGICHRDIKPHNLLVKGRRLVLCDFGSAKILTNQPNLPYICSRCYRAPQLIFGATHYSTMIDIWSVGCVILEMLHGNPLFVGESSIDHLIEIIKVMGTPTKTQVIDMNPDYDLNDYKFPKVKKREWRQVFPKADILLLDLLSQIMIYSPNQRLNAAQALAHEYFDELREQKVGKQLQKELNVSLFDFSYGQVRGNEHLLPKLIPAWVKYN